MSSIRRIVKPRLSAAIAIIIAVILGLGSRHGLTGFWAKYLGVAFWALGVYSMIVFVRPTTSAPLAAMWALAICWGVEFAQLTPVPAYLSSKHVILRLIFGAHFNRGDLVAYAVGIACASGLRAVFRFRRMRAAA